jgi:hypothetical protein
VLHRLVPSRKRIAALGLGAFAVLVVAAVGEATTKKPIIILYRGFQPAGEINRPGTLVKLHGAKPQQEIWEIGDRFSFAVTVVQPQTGAKAVGQVQTVLGVGTVSGNNFILARVVPGSPRFRAGPAKATAVVSRLSGTRVIDSFTWTTNVVLKQR